MKILLSGVPALGALILLGGCASYNQQAQSMDNSVRAGDFAAAAAEAMRQAEKKEKDEDQLVTLLELGSAMRNLALFHTDEMAHVTYTGNPKSYELLLAREEGDPYGVPPGATSTEFLQSSINVFEDAYRTFEYWDQQPELSATQEVTAVLAEQSSRPYRGTASERVMSETYQALNYLQLSRFSDARVAFNRMHAQQRAAVARYAKEIEKAQEMAKTGEGAEDGKGYNASKALSDDRVKTEMGAGYAQLDALKPYGDYSNPFALWLEGIFLLHCAENQDDLEKAVQNLELVVGMSDNRDHFVNTLTIANEAADLGISPKGITYVVFESGFAPHIDQFKIHIPIFIVNSGHLPYAAVSIPTLKLNETYVRSVHVHADGAVHTPALVCDMDRVVSEDFNRRRTLLITRAIISAGAKATLSYITNKTAEERGGFLAGLASKVATSVYQGVTSNADMRCWHMLPKEFRVAAIPTPTDGLLRIESPNGEHKALEIQLGAADSHVVYLRSVGPLTPLLHATFPLDPAFAVEAPEPELAPLEPTDEQAPEEPVLIDHEI